MFDFQKEVIINSNVLEDGVTPRFKAMTGAVNLFRVLRCADYRKEGLIDGVVYKTMYNKGVAPSVILNVPTDVGIYRVIVGFSLDGKYLSDYAYPWYKFGKPIMAEFELDASNLADAQEIMIKAIEMAIPENYRFARVTKVDTSKVKISGIVTDSIKDKLQGNSSILFVVSPTYLYILECLLPINCKPFKTIKL